MQVSVILSFYHKDLLGKILLKELPDFFSKCFVDYVILLSSCTMASLAELFQAGLIRSRYFFPINSCSFLVS